MFAHNGTHALVVTASNFIALNVNRNEVRYLIEHLRPKLGYILSNILDRWQSPEGLGIDVKWKMKWQSNCGRLRRGKGEKSTKAQEREEGGRVTA